MNCESNLRVVLAVGLFLPGGLSRVALAANPLAASVTQLAAPTGPGAMGSMVVSSPDGAHWLSWLEPDRGAIAAPPGAPPMGGISMAQEEYAFKCARFDPVGRRWGEAHLIAHGPGWFINWEDFPALAATRNRLAAAWLVGTRAGEEHGDYAGYHVEYSTSNDAGKSWSTPQPITGESSRTSFIALQAMADGRFMAAWLDGRERAEKRTTLYSRIIGDSGPDLLVDASTCGCCTLSFIPTAGGGVMLAYRGRTNEEIRDMRVSRFAGGKWSAPRPLHADGWMIPACPDNGPQLAISGGNIAAAWFTAANGQPRVYLARTQAGGRDFADPAVIDLGRAAGRVDSILLPDGTALVTWIENSSKIREGGIYLRAQSSDGVLSAPVLLASTASSRATGVPRITLLPDSVPAQFLLCYTRDSEPLQVVTALVTVESLVAKAELVTRNGQD